MQTSDLVPNLRHLRAFSLTARHNSVNRAAVEICLSQPAVTQAIGKLETQYGESFFDRAPTGMYCTPFGRLFLARVDRALAFLEQAAADAGGKAKGEATQQTMRKLTAAHLRAVIAIADNGSFAVAARALGVSLAWMQRTANALEHAVDAKLFLRAGKGVVLSAAGERFARGAKLATREIEIGVEEIENLRGYRTGRIVIGSMPLARVDLVPRAITQLLKSHPDLRIRIVEGPYPALIAGLRTGEIDLVVGALREPAPHADVEERALFDDPLSLLVRAGHPLARQKSVSLADTIGYPWIVPPPGAPARTLFHDVFRTRAVMEPKRLVEVSSIVSLRSLMMESDRIAFVSRRQFCYEEAQGALVALPVELPEAHRPIGVMLRADWEPSSAQSDLLAEIEAAIGEAVVPGVAEVRRTRRGISRARE